MIDPLVTTAEQRPDAQAVSDAAHRWTWRQLLADANDLSQRLRTSPGGRIALLSMDTGSAVVAIHAVWLAAATLVPLNRRLTVAELVPLLARSGAMRLLHDDHHATIAAEIAAGVPGMTFMPLDVPGSDRGAATEIPTAARTLDPAALAAVVFTSGTTGEPRGVRLTHTNLLASAHAWNAFLDSNADDHWLATLPLSHVAGLGVVMRSVVSGARLTIHDRFDPTAVRTALALDGVTFVSLVPTQLCRLLDDGPVAAPRLRALLLGGAPIPAALVERAVAAGLPTVTTYGMTEAASGVTALSVVETPMHPGSAGRALPGSRVRVRFDDGSDAPSGVSAEIAVAGPSIFTGYDGDQTTTDAVLSDGWFRTGDLGSLDADGLLTVSDRRDDLIISGGENISPVEVETVLLSHPDVTDAAVVGRPDATWGAVPVAAVVLRSTGADLHAIEALCRDRLAGYKVPVTIEPVAAIPRTASGKIVRHEVRRSLEAIASDLFVDRQDGARIHVRRRGHGPVLVLLHATLSNAQELDPLAIELAQHHDVLAIDRRSAGSSLMPSADVLGPIDAQVHIDDVAAVLDALALPGPVFMVGHSYGACVGLEFAARHPGRVARAFLFEPPYLGVLRGTEAESVALGRRITAIARADGLGAAALAFLETVNGPGIARRLPASVLARLESEGRTAVADSALAGFDPVGLAGVRARVRIGLGGHSKGPYAAIAAALADRIPTLDTEHFPTLGHGGPITGAVIVAPAILASFAATESLAPPAPAPGGSL
ncbi:MAG: o-succinylbenzoate--CoA ligase [Chloroflexi bacterium]|nr:o-succinylbenzoate--CoA ligase [Chloroflexota bacterium]